MSLKTINIQDDQEKIVRFEISVLSRNTFNYFIVRVSRYMMKMDITLRWMTPSVRRSTNWWKKLTAHTVERRLFNQLPTSDFSLLFGAKFERLLLPKILATVLLFHWLFHSANCLTDIPEDCSVIPFNWRSTDELYSTRRQPDQW